MSNVVRLRAALPLVAENSSRAWIDLAYEGEWKGHHAGEFSFTESVFANIVKRFSVQKNPIPITYEHPEKYMGTPIKAAGWIHDLRIQNGHLWGLAEFTPDAAQMVKNGEYRFCSVVVDFASIDRKSGEEVGPELYEVGLTNTPFLDGQRPIALSRYHRPVIELTAPAPVRRSTTLITSPEILIPGIRRR